MQFPEELTKKAMVHPQKNVEEHAFRIDDIENKHDEIGNLEYLLSKEQFENTPFGLIPDTCLVICSLDVESYHI